jgi:hypothetical protein
VNLAQPGPLVAGMRVDVYFGPNAAAQDKTTGNKTTEGKPAEGKAAQGESKPAQ